MKNQSAYEAFYLKREETDDLGAILNCAIRYCIGRESYMPKLVTEFIRKHPEMLNAKTCAVMIRDIEQARREPIAEIEARHGRTSLGFAYQYEMWLNFQSWLKEQEAKLDAK